MKKKKSKWMWAALSLPLLLGFGPATPPADGQAGQVRSETAYDVCTTFNSAFQHGEELTYKVYYNLNFIWIPAGEAVFRVDKEGDQFHLSVRGTTYKSYEWFFKVRDNYDTYVETASLLPRRAIRDIREGGYTLYEKVDFDQGLNKAFVIRGRSKEKIKEEKEIPLDACMHDILSLIYYTRNLDFDQMAKGAQVPVKIFIDQEVWPLNMTFKGRTAKKSIKGLGKFDVIEFSPQVIEGMYFKEGTEMKIWASDDRNKIPLLIESPVSVGSIKAVLKDYKGLRHDFSAMKD
jgi:hypothetical protein